MSRLQRFCVFAATKRFQRLGVVAAAEGSAVGRRRPMRPWGPTTKGRERAFQCWSASAGSLGLGWRGRQLRPSSVEMSVPLGPTVIQVLEGGS